MNEEGKCREGMIARELRIFVSSPFRDMHEERDILARQVRPKLRRLCNERESVLTLVDLRWGISQAQSEQGETIPICLREIDRCRPFFIGILGEYYGWTDYRIPDHVLSEFPWLKDVEVRGKSATWLEIIHGVLKDPGMRDRAHFYFRQDGYRPDDANYRAENPEAARKQQALKQEIAAAVGANNIHYYATPDEFGQFVESDLLDFVEVHLPEAAPLTPLHREIRAHQWFASTRIPRPIRRYDGSVEEIGVYLQPPSAFRALEEHIGSDSQRPLAVFGGVGLGKTALLANLAEKLKTTVPDTPVVERYIGATHGSTNWAHLLRFIMEELKERFGLDEQVAESDQLVKEQFPEWLRKVSARGKCVLILDALDQLENRDAALELGWLPEFFPPGIRVIVSALKGLALEAMKRRNWDTYELLPMDEPEREHLIVNYLNQYRKALTTDTIRLLVESPSCGNPLYLRLLLDELMICGRHETLRDTAKKYLDARGVPGLVNLMLERWETDYGQHRPALVQDSLRLILASKRGLSEDELLALLGGPDAPLPLARFAAFHGAADAILLNRSGYLRFAHAHMESVVAQRYMKDKHACDTTHAELARFFQGSDDKLSGRDPARRRYAQRTVEELPYQYCACEDWTGLARLLEDPILFVQVDRLSPFELLEYWNQLELHAGHRLENAYSDIISNPEKNILLAGKLQRILTDLGKWAEAGSVLSGLVDYLEKEGSFSNYANMMMMQASLLERCGQLKEALERIRQLESKAKECVDGTGVLKQCVATRLRILVALGNFAAVTEMLSTLDDATRGYSDAFLRESAAYPIMLQRNGRMEEAMEVFREHEREARQNGDQHQLAAALGNQAANLYERGEIRDAQTLLRKQELLCRKIGARSTLRNCLGNQSNIMAAFGNMKKALELSEEQEKLSRLLGDQNGAAEAIGNRSDTLSSMDMLDEALALCRQEGEIFKGIENRRGLCISRLREASILKQKGDLRGAFEIYEVETGVCRKEGYEKELSKALNGQGNIYADYGENERALSFYREDEQLCRKRSDLQNLANSLGNQALIFKAMGKLDEALKLTQEEEAICRNLGYKIGLVQSLGTQGVIWKLKGDISRALALYKKQEQLARESNFVGEIVSSLNNQAVALSQQSRIEEALALHDEQIRFCRLTDSPVQMGYAMANKARLLAQPQGGRDIAGAIALAQEALRLGAQAGNKELCDHAGSVLATLNDLAKGYARPGSEQPPVAKTEVRKAAPIPKERLNTYLLMRADANNDIAVRCLLDLGADPDAVHPPLQATALMFAAVHGNFRMAQTLLACGADATMRSAQGKTALDYADNPRMRVMLQEAVSGARPCEPEFDPDALSQEMDRLKNIFKQR